jgi:hypothetical protein
VVAVSLALILGRASGSDEVFKALSRQLKKIVG